VKIVRASGARRGDLLPTDDEIARARSALREAGVEKVVMLRRGHVAFAVESLRPEGSFKIRGAVAALARRRGPVVAASAGNHGIGVASAAKRLGLPATVVVPKTAPRKKVDVIESYGCELLEEGEGYEAAEAFAMKLAKDRDVPFLSPYDDIDVVAGNGATLGLEIVEALGGRPKSVVAPIGGGGLATGLACALGEDRIVWGAQSEASPAFARSLERGEAVTTLPYAKSLADGIEGGIAVDAFARAAGTLAGAIVVSEDSIAHAMSWAAKELGLVIEGSAAAALAPVLEGFETDCVVLTGRNV
jgi:threonine dehydratase